MSAETESPQAAPEPVIAAAGKDEQEGSAPLAVKDHVDLVEPAEEDSVGYAQRS